MDEHPEFTPPVIQRMLYAILTQKQREKFEEVWELDFAYAVPGKARFRVNIYRQRDAMGAAFRVIPFDIKPLEALGVPRGGRQPGDAAARIRPCHRPHRFGQVDHARGDRRPKANRSRVRTTS